MRAVRFFFTLVNKAEQVNITETLHVLILDVHVSNLGIVTGCTV